MGKMTGCENNENFESDIVRMKASVCVLRPLKITRRHFIRNRDKERTENGGVRGGQLVSSPRARNFSLSPTIPRYTRVSGRRAIIRDYKNSHVINRTQTLGRSNKLKSTFTSSRAFNPI